MNRTSFFSFFVVATLLFFSVPVYATDQSSGSFQIDQSTTTSPVRGSVTSSNFSIDFNVGEIVGSSTSGSFMVNSGETQPPGATSTPTTTPPPASSGGGGGGGVFIPPTVGNITMVVDASCPVYKASVLLYGGVGSSVDAVRVNGSSDGVTYPTSTSWQKNQTLVLGSQSLSVMPVYQGRTGTASNYTFVRHGVGDITNDGAVDDFDLSLLVSHWDTDWCQADFNTDSLVDDFDLSLLVTAWTF